ncbi:FAD-dependent oxidoreductase [Klebsiella aerogenes]|nr:FAD-dependent oxidoreductase [Klebsiella aerogenes]
MAAAARLESHLKSLANKPASCARNTFAVSGAGFTDLEIFAELPSRLHEILGQDIDVQIILVERNREIGEGLGDGPRPFIVDALTELGVTWKMGSGVAEISEQGVRLENGEFINADTVIWTTGARARTTNSGCGVTVISFNFGGRMLCACFCFCKKHTYLSAEKKYPVYLSAPARKQGFTYATPSSDSDTPLAVYRADRCIPRTIRSVCC